MDAEDWLSDSAPHEPAPFELTVPRPVPCPFKDADAGTLAAWEALRYDQQVFLSLLPHVRFSLLRAEREMRAEGFDVPRRCGSEWARRDKAFARLIDTMRAVKAGRILDKANLIIRHDKIVRELLRPQPILYQGAPTGYYENRAPAAASANETLMKAAGLLKGQEQSTRVTVRVVNLAGPAEADAEGETLDGEATVVE